MVDKICKIYVCFLFSVMVCSQAMAWAPGEQIGHDLDWVRLEDAQATPPDPMPQPGEVWKEPVTGMEMVWIPGGCFTQGSPETEVGRYADETPTHETCVDGFWMGKYEVTNAEYRKFRPKHTSKEYKGQDLNQDRQPVVYVSWKDAMAFVRWLSAKSGGKYTFWLPTEAEWEYACRAGTTTSRFWGDDLEPTCQYANVADESAKENWKSWDVHPCEDGYIVTAPVGQYDPNPFGLHDMLGNVWEWCQDWKGPYSDEPGPYNNPVGPTASKEGKMVRGGSWDNEVRGIRCGNRSYGTDNFKRYNDGFRIVRTR